jgi:PAS domain S-box-containing protein
MRRLSPRSRLRIGRSPATLALALTLAAAGGMFLVFELAHLSGNRPLVLLVLAFGLFLLGLGLAGGQFWERKRWAVPVRTLARNLAAFNAEPDQPWDLNAPPQLAELVHPVLDLQASYLGLRGQLDRAGDTPPHLADSGELRTPGPIDARMTRSGSFEPPPGARFEPMASGEFTSLDMISRLEPRTFRWLDSSLSEQVFLGWTLEELKGKSFLEIVRPDDRELARQQLRAAVARGEGHGLVYRIATAGGETRAVELNVGVRYGPDRRILHLRCHLADVTAKLRDETELRRRTQELIQANDQLRRTNRVLEELKDRYGDLYQNAPAMYLTVDSQGYLLECNDTMVRTLGHDRGEIVNRPCARFLPEGRTPTLSQRFAEALQPGPIEFESEWARADGGTIFVWVTGSAVAGTDGKLRHYRCVAQDITARRALEAEVRVKNDRLAAANAELLRKNKELDEFTYVVSHDLQEPLRTLIAFSDFLMRDQGDRLDDAGREHVRYLVEASRRLRALIQDLLSLSRAGKVTGEFAAVNLDEVVETLRADFAELVRSRGAEIRVEGPLPAAWGDRDRIGQLLANLVGNGLKYNTGPDPLVVISALAEGPGGRITLAVRDNGIGIDPQFHSKIFQLFRRLHTREEYEGTGAGLAICQKIAQAHGGRIWVESEPGRGATFRVTLPGIPEGAPARRTEVLHAS